MTRSQEYEDYEMWARLLRVKLSEGPIPGCIVSQDDCKTFANECAGRASEAKTHEKIAKESEEKYSMRRR